MIFFLFQWIIVLSIERETIILLDFLIEKNKLKEKHGFKNKKLVFSIRRLNKRKCWAI